jgi:hypothetical protein
MKRTFVAGCAILGLLTLFLAPTNSFAARKKGAVGEKHRAMIERGQYLVTVTGCNDCHSPKIMTPNGVVPDGNRLLSGQPADERLPMVPPHILGPTEWGALTNNHLTAWVGPWGTSYAANLTPDRDTGTGAWNAELFIRIIRTGKFMGSGRDLLPPMPWYNYAKFSDADLGAIFAYLKSLRPIKNPVPPAVLAPVAKLKRESPHPGRKKMR